MLTQMDTGSARAPLRVALLTSRRAPGLTHLLRTDPYRGGLYDLVAAVVSDSRSEVSTVLADAGVPCAIHDLRDFCAMRGARVRVLGGRGVLDGRFGPAELLPETEPARRAAGY